MRYFTAADTNRRYARLCGRLAQARCRSRTKNLCRERHSGICGSPSGLAVYHVAQRPSPLSSETITPDRLFRKLGRGSGRGLASCPGRRRVPAARRPGAHAPGRGFPGGSARLGPSTDCSSGQGPSARRRTAAQRARLAAVVTAALNAGWTRGRSRPSRGEHQRSTKPVRCTGGAARSGRTAQHHPAAVLAAVVRSVRRTDASARL